MRAIDLLVMREEIEGVVNLASPNPLPNRDFMRELREAQGTYRLAFLRPGGRSRSALC